MTINNVLTELEMTVIQHDHAVGPQIQDGLCRAIEAAVIEKLDRQGQGEPVAEQRIVPLEIVSALNDATGGNAWQGEAVRSELLQPACAAIAALAATQPAEPVKRKFQGIGHLEATGYIPEGSAEERESKSAEPVKELSDEEIRAIYRDALNAMWPNSTNGPRDTPPPFVFLYSRALLARCGNAAQPSAPVDVVTASEAVYAFAAWLTCRNQAVTVGSTHDAVIVADLVGRFVESQGWVQPRNDYTDRLRDYPPEAATQPAGEQAQQDGVTYGNSESMRRNQGMPGGDI